MKTKKYDYTLARELVKFTSIIFFVQLFAEVVATRDDGFFWVLPFSASLLGVSLLYSLLLVVMNARQK